MHRSEKIARELKIIVTGWKLFWTSKYTWITLGLVGLIGLLFWLVLKFGRRFDFLNMFNTSCSLSNTQAGTLIVGFFANVFIAMLILGEWSDYHSRKQYDKKHKATKVFIGVSTLVMFNLLFLWYVSHIC